MPSDHYPDERETTDPALARSVVERRGGFPAHRSQTEGEGDHGLLVITKDDADEDVTEITWSEFEEKNLAFVYPSESDAEEVGTLQKQDVA